MHFANWNWSAIESYIAQSKTSLGDVSGHALWRRTLLNVDGIFVSVVADPELRPEEFLPLPREIS